MENKLLNRVFVNSLPKSGTHLLTKTVEILGYQEYAYHDYIEGTPKFINYRQAKQAIKQIDNTEESEIGIGAFAPYYVNTATVKHWFASLGDNIYIQGHIPYTPALTKVMQILGYRHLVIIRDPRAVIASFLPFVLEAKNTDMGAHFLEADFLALTPDKRLELVLNGGYAPHADLTLQPFSTVYQSVLAWQQDESCLFLRFEDLVGEMGGGSKDKQQVTVEKIANFLNIEYSTDIQAKLATIYNPQARTFRTGKVDGWKTTLDADSAASVAAYCAPLCAAAGYVD